MTKWIRIAAVLATLGLMTAHAQHNVRIGYESYGQLNAAHDNAIFIVHFSPGFWDGVIGPGKPFDTDRYFILNANIDARDTTLRDFASIQKALADSLGIERFAATAGPSTGSFQVMEWAAAYPGTVARVIAVVPGGLAADPEYAKQLAARLKAHGTQVEEFQVDGGLDVAKAGDAIRAFLQKDVSKVAFDRDFDFD